MTTAALLDRQLLRDPWLMAADELDPPAFMRDPALWVSERMGEFLWSKQRDIAASVAAHRRTAVHSAHDVGKSFLASRIACWWIESHPPGEAFVVSTAPTFTQVKAVLWREIGAAHEDAKLRGRVNLTEWYIGRRLVAKGWKPAAETAVPTERGASSGKAVFQGIHARYVLVILDEAGGVPASIWEGAEALTTNEHARILAIGNPEDPTTRFAEVCAPDSGWSVIHVDGHESPNFTHEQVPEELRDLLLSPRWAEEKRQEWGEDSALYVSKVRGRFPTSASDGVVPLGWVRRCQADDRPAVILDPVELGVDVGAGVDQTVIRERRGPVAGRAWRIRTADSEKAVALVLQAIDESGAVRVKVDVIGVGWGIAGRLEGLRQEGRHTAEIVYVNVAEASAEPHRFPNLRCELWWEIGRRLSQDGGWDLRALDEDTVAQLIAPKWKLQGGRTKVESKEETKKRLHRSSPDDADALLLAFYVPPTRTAQVHSTLPSSTPPVTRKGDLVLVGERYRDAPLNGNGHR